MTFDQRLSRKDFLRLSGAGIAGVSLLGVTGCGNSGDSGEDESDSSASVDNLVWGSSSQGSSYNVLAIAMAEQVSQNTDISATVQAVGGSEATVRAIGEGSTEVGTSNSLASANGYNGESPFEQPIDNLRVMTQGHESQRQLIVREDSGIETPADLEGKTIIGERPTLIEIRQITDAILDAYGVDSGTVSIESTAETGAAITALQQGSVDGALLPGAGAQLLELSQNANVKWIDLSENIDPILGTIGDAIFVAYTIPSGTYEGQDEDVTTVALPSYNVVDSELPNEAVYSMTKAILENNDAVADAHPEGENWTTEQTMSQPPAVPFHAGAVQYFEEVGVWTDEMQQNQDELLSQ